ncbi:MAG: hypothetical protein U0931_19615 [Vulcanimicrobiota bacterium]
MSWESWLLDEGERVAELKAAHGLEQLSKLDLLLYCLWVGDYSLRNAGDLEAGEQLLPGWLPRLVELARELGLDGVASFFEKLPAAGSDAFDLYWDHFDQLCQEVSQTRER